MKFSIWEMTYPDMLVMEKVGVATCPQDAVSDIKKISHYVSHKKVAMDVSGRS